MSAKLMTGQLRILLIGSPCLVLLTGVFRRDHLCQCIRCGTVWFDKTKCIVSLSFVTRPPRPRHPPSTLSMVAAEHTRASPPASGLWKGNQIPTNRPRGSGGTSTDTTSGEKAECTGLCPGWFGWSLYVFFYYYFYVRCAKRKHPSTMHYFI